MNFTLQVSGSLTWGSDLCGEFYYDFELLDYWICGCDLSSEFHFDCALVDHWTVVTMMGPVKWLMKTFM